MKQHSKRYRAFKSTIPAEAQTVAAAVELLKSYPGKVDTTLELHIHLGIDPKKAEHLVRGSAELPHGTGKKLRIAAFVPDAMTKVATEAGATVVGGEELIKQIKTTEKIDFDIAIASPDMMRHLAQIAKLLGTRGLMPNPKTETVTTDIAATIKSLQGGKVNFRMDDAGNIHQAIGRSSFTNEQLVDNTTVMINAVTKLRPSGVKGAYIRSLTLSTAHSPSVMLQSV